MTTTSATARRTQAERRAATRTALLQATIDCLVELGYAGTTTNEIQQRAGVSRGALTHHFASKAELLLAAMDHLYEDHSASVRDAAGRLPVGRERIRPAIWLLWERFDGPLFYAAMELWIAARTDPELRAALLPHERRLGRDLRQLAVEVFGDSVAAHPAAEVGYQVLLTSMRGQAMTYALQPDAPRVGPHLQYWYDLVEAFATRPPSPASPASPASPGS
jgi:AcrR family transcriptional regulator